MSWNRARLAGAVALAALAGGCGWTPPMEHMAPASESFGKWDATNFAAMTGRGMDPARLASLRAAFRAAAPDTVTFAFDDAAIEPAAARALAAQAAWLRAHPAAMVAIEGHADLVGAERYNQRIGLRRAQAVAARLAALGVGEGQLALVLSRGERDPLVPTPDEERANRRAVSTVEGWGAGWRGRSFNGKRAYLAYTDYTTKQLDTAPAPGTGG